MTLFFRFLTVAALIVVAIGSLGPGPTATMGSLFTMDKLLHFIAYGGLAGLARLGWPKAWGGWVFLIVSGFGALIEVAQHTLTEGRTASFLDLLANLGGALSALIAFHILRKMLSR